MRVPYNKIKLAVLVVLGVVVLLSAYPIFKTKITASQKPIEETFNPVGDTWSVFIKTSDNKLATPLRTSAWWKSAYISPCAATVFPYPYILTIMKNGIGLGVPSIHAADNAVIMAKEPDFILKTPDTTNCSVENQDTLSATFVQNFDNGKFIKATASKGLGFVNFSTNLDKITLDGTVTNLTGVNEKLFTYTINNKNFGILFDRNANGEQNTFTLNNSGQESYFSVFYVPDNAAIEDILSGVYSNFPRIRADLNVEGNQATNTFTGEDKTLWYLLPTQMSALKTENVVKLDTASVPTLRGNMTPVVGTKLSFTYPIDKPLEMVNSKLSDAEKSNLKNLLDEDMKTVTDKVFATEAGSYWQGKILFKYANMLYISKLLGDTDNFNTLQKILETELKDWSNYSGTDDKKYFIYDQQNGGIISSKPEYGNELYNDHYLQYGYFIYAYTAVSTFDAQFKTENKPIVDFLVKDIADTNEHSKYFPYQRHFDMYEGHGYASGLSYFGDGNDQESSSEAVNAWYSSYLWEKLNNNNDLANQYLAMLTLEQNNVNAYYFKNPNFQIFPDGYKHDSVGILWEGKYDFATWFGNKNEEVVGIQLLPFTFASHYLKNQALDKILSAKSVLKNGDLWYDILTSYKLLNSTGSINLSDVPQAADTAHSRSWMYFVLTQLTKY